MALLRITCPECGAGLKSASGFTVGRTITCPKCESDFVVEDPDEEPAPKAKGKPAAKKLKAVTAAVADDDDEDRPKKKKKKKKRGDDDEDEEGWSYKNSWIRFAVLGVLLVVLVVLAVMLKKKWDKDKENTEAPPPAREGETRPSEGTPRLAVRGGIPREVQFNPQPQPGGFGGFPGFGSPAVDPAELQRRNAERTAELTGRLAGSWRADLGNGVTQRVEYRADGTYTDTVTGGDRARQLMGTWKVAGLVGTKGLKLTRTGGGRPQVNVVFEGDELVHDADEPGVTAVFRKA